MVSDLQTSHAFSIDKINSSGDIRTDEQLADGRMHVLRAGYKLRCVRCRIQEIKNWMKDAPEQQISGQESSKCDLTDVI